jgi:hypothetical protein
VNRDAADGDSAAPPDAAPDPLAGFRNWRAFFVVAVLVNGLFVHGMWAAVGDAKAATWIKTLSWFPFNAIATVLYYAFMARLGAGPGGGVYRLVCVALIALNWIALIVA